MAQYDIPNPEDHVECPYDKTHMIRAMKMPYHLMKCKKNFPGLAMATCPFNAKHVFPKVELQWHLANCVDRAMIEQDLSREAEQQNTGSYLKGDCSNPHYDPAFAIEPSEDWDDEVEEESHQPYQRGYRPSGVPPYCHDLSGMKPAQKRAYYEQVREEFYTDTPVQMEKKKTEPDAPLRLPRAAPQVLKPLSNYGQVGNPPQQQSTVNKLAYAGIGRGQPKKQFQDVSNGYRMAGVSSEHILLNLAQGRGVGRGTFCSEMKQALPVGRGRGRGKTAKQNMTITTADMSSTGMVNGAPQFIVPNVNEANSADSTENQNTRDARRLEKKLRGIQTLEIKQNGGEELNDDEMDKLNKKRKSQSS